MTALIARITALEILDSRGNPTVRVDLELEDGIHATASVPSGASTGAHEAAELRDKQPRRYGGLGVRRAVASVEAAISPALRGMDPTYQADIDKALIDLDGTPDKSRLGANAILAVSQACARAAARSERRPLYDYLARGTATRLPVPMLNIINGGKHADSNLDIQEFMIVPRGAKTFSEALRWAAETFHALGTILKRSGYSVAVGDEGGYAPLVETNEEALDLVVAAIRAAGYRPGADIAIALDAAATSFHVEGQYRLSRTTLRPKSSDEMLALYTEWIDKYPIAVLEDPFAETDWEGFRAITRALGARAMIVGDDLLCTNTALIARAVEEEACTAALIKLNQIGTVSETMAAIESCRRAGWQFVVSHRSGETDDAFMADFAVAMDGGWIKAGSVCRGERVAKYNRLLVIEQALGERARFGS